MKMPSIPWQSLKTRIVFFSLTIFVISTWGLFLYASQILRKDMEQQLSEQQFSTVSLLSAQVNQDVLDRMATLEGIAKSIQPFMMSHAPSLQTFLEQRPYFLNQFNDGVMAYGPDGVAMATFPLSPERIGVNYLDRDYLIGALKEGEPTIGRPVIGKTLKTPIFLMAVPVRDSQGKVIGALSGVTNLGKPNFLDKITDHRYGKTGGYTLISPQHRLIVTATEKSRIMNSLLPLGKNPVMDRYSQGNDGSDIYVNTRGVEMLSSAKGVPAASWFVLATLPTKDAFSPIRDMQWRMFLATLMLTLLSGGLTWWMLKKQLSPLQDATKALSSTLLDRNVPPQSLPVTRHDEIGLLIGEFNRLLKTLGDREESLMESEQQFRNIFDEAPIGYHQFDTEGRITRVNNTELASFGYTKEEMLGRYVWEFVEDSVLCQKAVLSKLAGVTTPTTIFEDNCRKKDGTIIPVLVQDKILHDKTGAITGIRSVVMDNTERKQAEEIINHLAFFDQLTDLPNRRLLQDRAKQAMASSVRNGNYGALLLIDLDHFKTLNDTLGHDMGDLLLKQVAQRLTQCVREEDTVARLGGDEFVAMLVNLSDNQSEAASQIELIGTKIMTALNSPYHLTNHYYDTTASIGASVFLGQQTEFDVLLKQADLAMYKAKNAGRNTFRFFDPKMALEVLTRASLDNDLREAIQKKQFILHYQAQMTDSQLTGAEALIRWQHPKRGLVFPGEFISVIEETGLILSVGQWVLECACKQLAEWATRPEMAHLTVAVNISARQFNQVNFVDQVLMVLDRSGAKPQRLKLELTESLLLNNIEDTIGKMTALKERGLGFSLDDFGTGYSSLEYLKRLPLDQLKIDQSFVRDILTDPNDAAIARMIIVLAENLGLMVIAEGVESALQRDTLAMHGCHAYQGYFFSRPLPLDEFELLVKQARSGSDDFFV